jgi:thioredoxin reductase (NADPH)
VRQTIIIGSGHAGYTAEIYAGRANLDPLRIVSSVTAGGALVKTTEVENVPGFPDGILGSDLMVKLQAPAERFGTGVVLDHVVDLQRDGNVKHLTVGNGEVHEALSVIFTAGSDPANLAPPSSTPGGRGCQHRTKE